MTDNTTRKAVAKRVDEGTAVVSRRVWAFGEDLVQELIAHHLDNYDAQPGFNITLGRIRGVEELLVVVSNPSGTRVAIAFNSEIEKYASSIFPTRH